MSANFRRRYITDFGRVEGVPGVYMANQLSLNMLHDSGNFHPINYEKFIKSKVCPVPSASANITAIKKSGVLIAL